MRKVARQMGLRLPEPWGHAGALTEQLSSRSLAAVRSGSDLFARSWARSDETENAHAQASGESGSEKLENDNPTRTQSSVGDLGWNPAQKQVKPAHLPPAFDLAGAPYPKSFGHRGGP